MIEIASPSPATIAKAAQFIRSGEIVAMPTETVYGLAADATRDDAVAKIYTAKGRPSFNPLIAHCASIEMVRNLIDLSETAERLAKEFWPGPLTLVGTLAPTNSVCETARAGLDSLAVRIPDHDVALSLIRHLDRPLVAPSANPSGRISPTLAEHVADDFDGDISMILNGGPSRKGVESTIIDVRGPIPHLLRPGPIPRTELEEIIGHVDVLSPQTQDPDQPRAPGQLLRHYAPKAHLRLNVETPDNGEALLGFGDCPGATLNLSPSGDIAEATRNLFAMLRTLDRRFDRIAVAPIPESQSSEALRDRLVRAAETS